MKYGGVMNMNPRYKSESIICKERGSSRFQALDFERELSEVGAWNVHIGIGIYFRISILN